MKWQDILKRRRIADPRKGKKKGGLSPEQQKKYGFKSTAISASLCSFVLVVDLMKYFLYNMLHLVIQHLLLLTKKQK